MTRIGFGFAESARHWQMGCTLGSKKLSISYGTGHNELDPTEVVGAQSFTRYARAMLGCEVPVGNKYRGIWYARLKEEMEVQGWTWQDLVHTVQYIQQKRKRVHKITGILYFVQEAQQHYKDTEVSDLHVKVAEAIAKERDETWIKRLSLASGKALSHVYIQWREANEVRG
jgi:hypothetical protein